MTLYDYPRLSATEWEFEFIGEPVEIDLLPGEYKFELWGAQGSKSGGNGGKGAYVKAEKKLRERIKVFLTVGGSSTTNIAGYNGGGQGQVWSQYAGGGATDLRFETYSLYSRFMVAAGGGGELLGYPYAGGAGGFEGSNGEGDDIGLGGRQTSGGLTAIGTSLRYGRISDGSFGYGGCANWLDEPIGQGGAGWYGGGAGGGLEVNGSGAGGSSFVWCEEYKDSTINSRNNTDFNLTEALLLENSEFKSGVREGHGKARITYKSYAILIKSQGEHFIYDDGWIKL